MLVFNGVGDFSSANVQLIAESLGNQRVTNAAALQLKNFAIDREGLIRPIIMKQQSNQSILSLDVAPNPFMNEFNLDIQMIQSGVIEVEIHNVYGQLVYQDKRDLSSGNHNILISELRESADGILLVSVKDANSHLTKKVFRAN
ncbi:MAG: hypothetical protein ACI8RY_001853 [Urechidicola sp.]